MHDDMRLDDAIDEIARTMTQGDPGSSFRESVRVRLDTVAPRRAPGFYAAGALAVMVALGGLWVVSNRREIEPAPRSVQAPLAVVQEPRPITQTASDLPGQSDATSRSSGRVRRTEARPALALVQPTVQIEPLEVTPIEMEPLDRLSRWTR